MTEALKWADARKELDSLSQEDWDEIQLKVDIIREILASRKEEGLTQKELEERSGVKQTFIARLENNRMDPQLTTVLRILRPLGKTLAVVPIQKKNSELEPVS